MKGARGVVGVTPGQTLLKRGLLEDVEPALREEVGIEDSGPLEEVLRPLHQADREPRPLHENATSESSPHASQRARVGPCAS